MAGSGKRFGYFSLRALINISVPIGDIQSDLNMRNVISETKEVQLTSPRHVDEFPRAICPARCDILNLADIGAVPRLQQRQVNEIAKDTICTTPALRADADIVVEDPNVKSPCDFQKEILRGWRGKLSISIEVDCEVAWGDACDFLVDQDLKYVAAHDIRPKCRGPHIRWGNGLAPFVEMVSPDLRDGQDVLLKVPQCDIPIAGAATARTLEWMPQTGAATEFDGAHTEQSEHSMILLRHIGYSRGQRRRTERQPKAVPVTGLDIIHFLP